MPSRVFRSLYPIAAEQAGRFTTAQAEAAGVGRKAVAALVRRGGAEPRCRGLFRLVHFPPVPAEALWEARLWAAPLGGVLAGWSAVEAHCGAETPARDSTIPPASVALPAAGRCRAAPGLVHVRRATLRGDDLARTPSGEVTTSAARTIRDLAADGIETASLHGVLTAAIRRRWIPLSEAEALARTLFGIPGPALAFLTDLP